MNEKACFSWHGFQQNLAFKGKCGVCGDDFSAKRPRLNENGGKWGTGTIGKTYSQGQVRN